jgi:hypothetical protein
MPTKHTWPISTPTLNSKSARGTSPCGSPIVVSPTVVTALAVAVGLLHGWLNGAAIAEAQREALGLLGIGGMTFVLVALVSAVVVSVQAVWARIAIRVAGSWIARRNREERNSGAHVGCPALRLASIFSRRRINGRAQNALAS